MLACAWQLKRSAVDQPLVPKLKASLTGCRFSNARLKISNPDQCWRLQETPCCAGHRTNKTMLCCRVPEKHHAVWKCSIAPHAVLTNCSETYMMCGKCLATSELQLSGFPA
jgi:hypothetical protein